MKRYAHIVEGTVANVTLLDPARIPTGFEDWVASGRAEIGWSYDGSTFAPPPLPNTDDAKTRDLTRREFTHLLAITGLEDVWDAVEARTKANDLPLYANLRSQRDAQIFKLSVTLNFVAQVAEIAAKVAPDADLSEAAIRAAWAAEAARS